MSSPSGRWVLTFNGEIYNFKALRRQLTNSGHSFKSESDTEVLVTALEAWGIPKTLKSLIGMFAFAAYDRQSSELTLARDRLGQKPLYYGLHNNDFVFCSELHCLKALPELPSISRNSAALMLRYKGIPAPHSIYQGIYKLLPGSFLTLSLENFELKKPTKYWNPFVTSRSTTYTSENHALSTLEHHLKDATVDRMASDVPLGAFLSGGIDSSLIVSFMQEHSSQAIKTFTIGFQDKVFNEANQAKAVADFLGTDHHQLYLEAEDIINLVPKIPGSLDEPFGDSSFVPTYLLSQLTRQHVTVALSGDGGDELFGGYNRHVWLPQLERVLPKIPLAMRHTAMIILNSKASRAFLQALSKSGWLKTRMLDDKIDKIVSLLSSSKLEDMYRDALSDWKEPSQVIRGAEIDRLSEFQDLPSELSSLQTLCYADMKLYLPDDILFKVDRASMAHSLESRSPFLDHRLVEFSLNVADGLKVRGKQGKYLPKTLLAQRLPQDLFDRPKMGFAVPLGNWLTSELRDWTESLLSSQTLLNGDLMRPEPVLRAWKEHLNKKKNHQSRLWNALILIGWLEEMQK